MSYFIKLTRISQLHDEKPAYIMSHITSHPGKCLQIQVVLEQQLNRACDIGTSIQSPTEVLAIELERN